MAERTIEVAGNRLNVAIDGRDDGPWLTCLHTLASNISLFEPQLDALAARYRVLRLDARGHGKSTAERPASTIADLAADVVGVWDALGIERTHVLGISMGGMTGLALAVDHPDRIDRLVIADCRADAPPFFVDMWNQRQETMRDKGMDAVADITLPIWYSEPTRAHRPEVVALGRAMIVGTSQAGYIGATDALKALDEKQRLPRIARPTLFLVGALDGPHPGEMRAMAGLVPGGKFVEIPDAAHVSNMEEPERFTHAVLDFLGG